MGTKGLVQSLPEAFALVPDPRGKQGRTYPLPAALALPVCDCPMGRLREPPVLHALGFLRDKTPCVVIVW